MKILEIILKKMTASLKSNGPFDFVKTMDPSKIAQLIKDEHPQTIALILYNIKYIIIYNKLLNI